MRAFYGDLLVVFGVVALLLIVLVLGVALVLDGVVILASAGYAVWSWRRWAPLSRRRGRSDSPWQ